MSTGTGLSAHDRYIRESDRDTAARKTRQSFGGPLDTLTVNHLNGVWKVLEISDTSSEILFRHGLNATTTRTSSQHPNVIWLAIFRHSGAGADTDMNLEYQEGDTISANEIGLRLRAVGRTIDTDNPVTAAVWFQAVEVPW